MNEVVVCADRSVAWRPVAVGIVMAVLVTAAGVLLRTVDPMALTGLGGAAVVVLMMGCARGVVWLVRAGRTRVVVREGELTVARGRRSTAYRVLDLRSVHMLSGERWPELSRWALHPRVVVTLRDGQEVSLPLLMAGDRVSAIDSALRAAVPGAV
jgi:hypothetical protein